MDPMTTPSDDKQPRDTSYWSQTSTLRVGKVPTGALNLNVEGRQLLGPLQGFGQFWEKTFRIRLNGAPVKPTEVIQVWKENFPKFWPKWDHYYLPLKGIAPGEVALINFLIPGDLPVGLPVSTGVMVIYSDEESFTFMDPQGHMFAGWITFSSIEEFGPLLRQEAIRRGLALAMQIVLLIDGAVALAKMGRLCFPTAIQIVEDCCWGRSHSGSPP